jgi:hypothetical protein
MDEHSEHGLFSPHGVSSTIAMPEPEASHVDWLEAFFGLTRPTIVKIQIVNSLVSRRAELLRTSRDNGEAGQKLRQEAAVLAKELGVDDGSSETALSMRRIDGAIGKPGRVSRGTNVSLGLVELSRGGAHGDCTGHAPRVVDDCTL